MEKHASQREPSGSGVAVTFLAGCLLIASGLILFIYGVSAIFSDIGRSTAVLVPVSATAWGFIHVAGGALLFLAGCNIFIGRYWARLVGVAVAGVAIIGSLISIETYPLWALILILLNGVIIWALTQHGNDVTF